MKKVVTSIAEMYVDENDILRIRMLPGVHVDLDKVKANFAASMELLEGRKALVLVDATAEYTITEEAKAFGASKESSVSRIAIAYLTRSIANKLMFNLYLKLHKPIVPTRMFSSEKAAQTWLRTFYVLPGDKFVKRKR